MGHHRFTAHADAPREDVFDLWVNVDRWHEWIEGLTRITDVSGPFDQAGTTYTAWFGRMRSPSEILEVQRPRLLRTRFGSTLLRGVTQATFEPDGTGTEIIQELWTEGVVAAIAGRIFAMGSYRGSFRGELNSFVRLAESETRAREAG